jgi:hypothetical protein
MVINCDGYCPENVSIAQTLREAANSQLRTYFAAMLQLTARTVRLGQCCNLVKLENGHTGE